MINRRKFINQLGFVSGGLVAGSILSSGKKTSAALNKDGRFGFLSEPYLQGLTENEVTICCTTNNTAFTWVNYGDTTLNKRAVTIKHGLIEANNTVNKITIKGLKPATTYRYQVYTKEILSFNPDTIDYGANAVSKEYTFTTVDPRAKQVSLLMLNDVHDRPDSIELLLKLHDPNSVDFVLMNGDIFVYETHEQQLFDNLFIPVTKSFAGKVPVLFNRGNHECRGSYARQLFDYFHFPYNNEKSYYTFRQGPVQFIVIDTGEDKPDDVKDYSGLVSFDAFREEQAHWMLNEVVNSEAYRTAAFRVVLMHMPLFHHNQWHGVKHLEKLFSPIFNKHNVNLVLSGHTHRHGIWEPDKDHNYPIIIGGGNKEGTRTITHLDATEKEIKVLMKLDNGDVLYDWKLLRKNV